MRKRLLWNISGVVLGFLLAFLLIVGVEGYSAVVHPFPPGVEQTSEAICRHVERYPQWILASVVPMWAAAALAGTWVAGRIGSVYSAGFVGLLLLAALALNLAMLPYPTWFKGACLIVVPAAIVAGGRFSKRRGMRDGISSTGHQPVGLA
ncbi:MAG: hypothetical protein ACYC61_26065 [Isosphaeraceae bacterium]